MHIGPARHGGGTVLTFRTDKWNLHLKALVAVAHMLQNPDFEERWMSATNEEQLRDVNLLIGLIALDAYNLRQKAPYWTEVAGRRFDR